MFDKSQCEHLAKLSKLSFKDKDLDSIIKDMSEITQFIDSIRNFNQDACEYVRKCTPYSNLRDDVKKK